MIPEVATRRVLYSQTQNGMKQWSIDQIFPKVIYSGSNGQCNRGSSVQWSSRARIPAADSFTISPTILCDSDQANNIFSPGVVSVYLLAARLNPSTEGVGLVGPEVD